MVEEQALVTKVLAGDPDAENNFYAMFKPRLHRVSMYLLGWNDSDAEDIVQETFLVAMAKLKDYDFRAPIFAWLRQICLRLCYARLRGRNRVLVSLTEDLEYFMLGMATERVQNDEHEVQKQTRLIYLEELKKRLGEDSRRIIELRDVQGLRYAQIALALDIPIGTVMSRLGRAREQLKKLVAEDPEDPLQRDQTRRKT